MENIANNFVKAFKTNSKNNFFITKFFGSLLITSLLLVQTRFKLQNFLSKFKLINKFFTNYK